MTETLWREGQSIRQRVLTSLSDGASPPPGTVMGRTSNVTDSPQFEFSPEEFSGTVRLFPLPNLVMFPHVVQPLHIFEPRYCDLLSEALEEDRLIGMATLVSGWESDYEGCPPISPNACLGRIMAHHALEDGTHNILLAGVARLEIVHELSSPKSFRSARAVLRADHYPEASPVRAAEMMAKFRQVLCHLLPFIPEAREQLEELLERDISLGTLTDLIAYLLDVDLSEKLILLGEDNVICRAEILVKRLGTLSLDTRPTGRGDLPFPPAPSRN